MSEWEDGVSEPNTGNVSPTRVQRAWDLDEE